MRHNWYTISKKLMDNLLTWSKNYQNDFSLGKSVVWSQRTGNKSCNHGRRDGGRFCRLNVKIFSFDKKSKFLQFRLRVQLIQKKGG